MEIQLSRILNIYDQWQGKSQFSKHTPVHAAFEEAKLSIENALSARGQTNAQVKFGYGKGNWASIPWISVDPLSRARISDIGLHIVILLREDRTGVYLTITQGVRQLLAKFGKRDAARAIFYLKDLVIPSLAGSIKERFQIDSLPDLRSLSTIAAEYQAANIVHRFYSLDDLEHGRDMGGDLALLLQELRSMQHIYMDGLSAKAQKS